MNRFPGAGLVGVAILGKVAGDMVLADPVMVRWLHPIDALRYAVDAVLVLTLVGGGQLRLRFFGSVAKMMS